MLNCIYLGLKSHSISKKFVLWEDIAPYVAEEFDIPHKKDYGIDSLTMDFKRSMQ